MKRTKDCDILIYRSKVKFRDVINLFKEFEKVEEEKEIRFRLSINVIDGTTYDYSSLNEFFASTSEIDEILKLKVVSIHVRSLHFNLTLDEGFSKVSYSLNNEGSALQLLTEKILNIRTKSVIFSLFNKPYIIFISAILAVFSFISYGYSIWGILGAISYILIMYFAGFCKFNKVEILMENGKDPFFIRRKEDFMINTIFLFLGALLGFVISNLIDK